ncbi:MAG: glycerophosphodiester phosphodiesterase [Lachnospiraceae bacterium]|nr:glycerophosphodiester phosphodiesterase [Lachnospiraceae bacterium]
MLIIKVIGIILLIILLLYLFLILPRMWGRPAREPHLHVLYAHRGLFDNHSDAPENSMAAFRLAVEAGYGIELDVQTTKDGVPVVFHDFTLRRMARFPDGEVPVEAELNEDGTPVVPGKICDYTWEELSRFSLLGTKERIPRFDEFLKLVNGRVPLIVELKIELKDLTVCRKASSLLDDYGGVYCVESFNPLGLFWYRRHRPEVMRGQLADSFRKSEGWNAPLYWLLEFLMFDVLSRPDFIAYNHKYRGNLSRMLTTGLFRALPVAWTIRSEEELAANRGYFDVLIFDSFLPAGGPRQG